MAPTHVSIETLKKRIASLRQEATAVTRIRERCAVEFDDSLGQGRLAVADFLHANPSYPTRELTGLFRFFSCRDVFRDQGIDPVLCMYDLTLPGEEAAREGGGGTIKQSLPRRSIRVIPRDDLFYFVQEVLEAPAGISPNFSAGTSELLKLTTVRMSSASQSVLHAKLAWYARYMAEAATTPTRMILASQLVLPMHRIAIALMEDDIRIADYFCGTKRRIFRQLNSDNTICNIWNDDNGRLRCQLTQTISTYERVIQSTAPGKLIPAMDFFYLALFLIRGCIQFGNSYGAAQNLCDKVNSVNNLGQVSYVQLAPDTHNSVPLPPMRVRTRSGPEGFSLLSLYLEDRQPQEIAAAAKAVAIEGR